MREETRQKLDWYEARRWIFIGSAAVAFIAVLVFGIAYVAPLKSERATGVATSQIFLPCKRSSGCNSFCKVTLKDGREVTAICGRNWRPIPEQVTVELETSHLFGLHNNAVISAP